MFLCCHPHIPFNPWELHHLKWNFIVLDAYLGHSFDLLKLRGLTRWTFFRVKLVFECESEISCSLGPWNPWTSSLLQHLLIIPLTSSYLLLSLPPTLLLWYGLVMGGVELWHCRMRLEMDLQPLYITFNILFL